MKDASRRKKASQFEDSGVGSGSAGGGSGSGKKAAPARQRVEERRIIKDTRGRELTNNMGIRLPRKAYEEYRRYAYFHRLPVRDIIGDAMLAFLPTIKKGAVRGRKKDEAA